MSPLVAMSPLLAMSPLFGVGDATEITQQVVFVLRRMKRMRTDVAAGVAL